MTAHAVPYVSDPDDIFVGRVLGYNVAETPPGISTAPSLNILIISSRLPGMIVSLTISPYMSCTPCEPARTDAGTALATAKYCRNLRLSSCIYRLRI